MTLANGAYVDYSYHQRDWPKSVTNKKSNGSVLWAARVHGQTWPPTAGVVVAMVQAMVQKKSANKGLPNRHKCAILAASWEKRDERRSLFLALSRNLRV